LEVEFNAKRFFLIIIVIVIVAGGAFILWLGMSNMRTATSGATPSATPTLSQKVVANLEIDLDNQSSWKVSGVDECLPKLNDWLDDKYPVKSLTVVITDTVTPDMTLGAAYPHPLLDHADPEAIVVGNCQESGNNGLSCQMAVQKGDQGESLDVAASVEIVQLVQWHFRPKTKKGWAEWQKNWKWENYRPIIEKEGAQWQSACLHLTH